MSGFAGLEFYDTTHYQKNFVTQPNPTHQAIKTDPTRRIWSGQVGFGRSAG